MKIALKLLFVALLPVCLIWFVGIYATNISERSLRDAIEQSSIAQAKTALEEIDQVVHMRLIGWSTYLNSALVQKTLDESNRSFASLPDQLQKMNDRDARWRSHRGSEPSSFMKELLGNELAKDLRFQLEGLTRGHGFPVFGEVFITNMYGANVAQTNLTSDYRQDDEHWWQAAVKERMYLGDVSFDESSGLFSTEICLRIDDADGNLTGVLKAVLNIQEAKQKLNRVAGGKRLALFTADHRLIHATFDDLTPLEDGSEYFVHQRTLEPAALATLKTDIYTVERTDIASGQPMLSAFAHSNGHEHYNGLGWILMVERSVKEVFAPIDELRRKIMIFASLSTIFALAFSGSIAYSISVRIKRLKAATLANKNGRLFEVAVQGTDEVADLAKSFNGMVKDLNHATAELQSQASHLETQNDCLQEEIVQRKQFQAEREKLSMQLIEASRQAGMAEVATGVLHNVGNVLTNVNVSANLIMEQRKNSRLATLARAADVITEHEHDLSDFLADDERGKRFPSLLRSLTKSLAAEQSNELGELNNLISSIDHIRAIVNKQQTFAGSFGQMELVESGELVSDALSLTKEGFERHGIQLKLDNQSFVLVTDKHKVLQILVNLVNNAKAAISANPPGNRLIEIRSRLANGQWDINVGDNGCGISLENQQRVFQHGFTTKSDGHGFGLHHSAISAQSLGGSIAMKSDGEGLGTTFTLTLPVKKEELCTS